MDYYNTSNNQLSIAHVLVEQTLYKNVVVEVDSIVSLSGGSVIKNYDEYDKNKQELVIPVVKVGKDFYSNSKIKIGRIISVESSSGFMGSIPLDKTLVGTPCHGLELDEFVTNSDLFGSTKYKSNSPIGEKSYACQIVNKADGFPVYSGNQSLRYEIRNGDCSANADITWNDCPNDRSRTEMEDYNPNNSIDKVITYEYMMFIPNQANFKPLNTFLTVAQVLMFTPNNYVGLAQLIIDDNKNLALALTTDFNWTRLSEIPIFVSSDPFNRWMKIKFEIKTTTSQNGYIRLSVDDRFIFEQTRQTSAEESLKLKLRLGIYNTGISRVKGDWPTQVIYYDQLVKTIN